MKEIHFGLVDVNKVGNAKFVDAKGKEGIKKIELNPLNWSFYKKKY